jgi:hypothetical protein
MGAQEPEDQDGKKCCVGGASLQTNLPGPLGEGAGIAGSSSLGLDIKMALN